MASMEQLGGAPALPGQTGLGIETEKHRLASYLARLAPKISGPVHITLPYEKSRGKPAWRAAGNFVPNTSQVTQDRRARLQRYFYRGGYHPAPRLLLQTGFF
ncbi:MAG: hypothetical protein FD153_495 [Rhodospirillaceae bacterium]|nr:MAG: hypothetical protein FD153_495 [Rhodospirillaceae bacterium]